MSAIAIVEVQSIAPRSFFSYFQATGFVGTALLVVTLVGVAMACRRWRELRIAGLAPDSLQKTIELAVRGQQYDQAAAQAEGSRTCLGDLVAAGLRLRRAGLDAMLANVERATAKASLRAGNRVANLARLGGGTLLLGVLGTVMSLINSASMLQVLKAPTTCDFVAGIAESLSSSAFALLVALASYIAYFWLDARAVHNILRVRDIAEELMHAAAPAN